MDSVVSVQEWESEPALISYVQRTGSSEALIVADAEAPKKFYSFSFKSDVGSCDIGIVATFHDVGPGVFFLNKGRIALIGLDEWLTGIDIKTANLIFRKNITGVFFGFIPLPTDEQVLVVHEIGALRVDARGNEVWSSETDMVGEFFLDEQGNLVIVEWDGGAKVIVNLETGRTTGCHL